VILVSNDDGIQAPGILALAQALQKVDQVAVIAPDRNWTATGHTKTLDKPLRITEVTIGSGRRAIPAYACDGSPSDAVSLGFLDFLPETPRLVVTGINRGSNLGSDVTYSGTVSAAMEGVVCGVPSIAVSLEGEGVYDYAYAATFAAKLAERVLAENADEHLLLNVNVPGVKRSEIKGVKVVPLGGKRDYSAHLIKREDPLGRAYYWFGGKRPEGPFPPDTDVWAVANNYVSVTPILLDLTNQPALDKVRGWRLRK
jgi:5'-nucleotidase